MRPMETPDTIVPIAAAGRMAPLDTPESIVPIAADGLMLADKAAAGLMRPTDTPACIAPIAAAGRMRPMDTDARAMGDTDLAMPESRVTME